MDLALLHNFPNLICSEGEESQRHGENKLLSRLITEIDKAELSLLWAQLRCIL